VSSAFHGDGAARRRRGLHQHERSARARRRLHDARHSGRDLRAVGNARPEERSIGSPPCSAPSIASTPRGGDLGLLTWDITFVRRAVSDPLLQRRAEHVGRGDRQLDVSSRASPAPSTNTRSLSTGALDRGGGNWDTRIHTLRERLGERLPAQHHPARQPSSGTVNATSPVSIATRRLRRSGRCPRRSSARRSTC